ncbi:MAG: BLUF domain-containing protein [Pseudomonadota bacterium]
MIEKKLRVAYYSKNKIAKTDDELMSDINRILVTSQRNNKSVGVTGALIFNRGVFAQVLEGPASAVERTFERIRFDMRHDHVTVLDSSPVEERSFKDWSMGFAGSEGVLSSKFEQIGGKGQFDAGCLTGNEMLNLLKQLTVSNELSDRAI